MKDKPPTITRRYKRAMRIFKSHKHILEICGDARFEEDEVFHLKSLIGDLIKERKAHWRRKQMGDKKLKAKDYWRIAEEITERIKKWPEWKRNISLLDEEDTTKTNEGEKGMSDFLDEAIENWDEWIGDCQRIHKIHVLYLKFLQKKGLEDEFIAFIKEQANEREKRDD